MNDIFQILIVTVFSIIYLYTVRKKDCRWAYVAAYTVRIGMLFFSVFGRNIGLLPFDGEDSEYFYKAVWEKTDHYGYTVMHDKFVGLTICLSYVIGDARLIYQYLLMILSMLGIGLTDGVMIKLGIRRRIRFFSLMLMAFFPSFVCLNVVYLREPIIMIFIIAPIYLFICNLKAANNKIRVVYLILSLVVGIMGCIFHPACISSVFGIMVAELLYDPKDDRFKITKTTIIAAIVFAIVICATYRFLPWKFEDFQIKDLAERFMFEKNLAAGSSYAQYVGDSATWGRFFFYTPVRMFYAMFAPLPWQWRGLADIGTFFLNSLFYIVVSVFALIDTSRRNYWKNINRWFVFTALIASAVVGWGCTAYGTSIRHRDEFFPIFIILMALEIRGNDKETEQTV